MNETDIETELRLQIQGYRALLRWIDDDLFHPIPDEIVHPFDRLAWAVGDRLYRDLNLVSVDSRYETGGWLIPQKFAHLLRAALEEPDV